MHKADVSTWIWIVSGIIVAALVFAAAYFNLGQITMQSSKQNVVDKYNTLLRNINGMCLTSIGNTEEVQMLLSKEVRAIYAANLPEAPPDKADLLITEENSSKGIYLCLQFYSEMDRKEFTCMRTDCEIDMLYIGKPTLDSMMEKTASLMGGVYEFDLRVIKTDTNLIKICSKNNAKCQPPQACNYISLVSCDRQPVLTLLNTKNMILFADTTPFYTCCADDDTVVLLKNIADYFEGEKILMVWEDKYLDPSDKRFDALRESFSTTHVLFNLRHTNEIDYDLIKEYNQLWILKPGWCQGTTKEGKKRIDEDYCSDVVPWSNKEVEAIKEYLSNGGKILITSEYSNTGDYVYMFQGTPNRIISIVDETAYFKSENICEDSKSVMIDKHFITNGVKKLLIGYSTAVSCN